MSTSDRYPGAAYIPSMGNAADMEDDRYIVMTKIMVLAMAVLFAAVFFVICLHIYTKWIWGSSSSTPPAAASTRASFWFWPRRSVRNEVTDMLDINMVVGLGKEAVEALPTFQYRKENSKEEEEVASMECAICLGQFQEDELGRSLPKCGHCFHLECIDMWLFSHSTCPLCRAVLQEAELEPDVVDLAAEPADQASSIQVFTQNSSTQQQSEQQSEQEPKRADSIPANVLFWGNLMQQQVGADSRQHRNNSSNSSQAQQIAIDIDNMGTTPRARTPRHGSNSSSS